MKIHNVIAVHGFMYEDGGLDDPRLDFLPQIEELVNQPIQLFSWYSAPFNLHWQALLYSSFRSAKIWGASWYNGYLEPYSYAYNELTTTATNQLITAIKDNYNQTNEKVILIAHSLGSRVAIKAAIETTDLIDKIVFLNGAELVDVAIPFVNLFSFPVLNIAVEKDMVLSKLGSTFSGNGEGRCIGHIGLGTQAPKNWLDVVIDNQSTIDIAKKRGWNLEGDDDGLIGELIYDHWYSYRNPGNYPIVRAFLNGDPLDDF